MYPCADGWVLISAGDDHIGRACARPSANPMAVRSALRRAPERGKNAAAINEAVNAMLSTMTMKDAVGHFTRHDVTAAPVDPIPQAARSSSLGAGARWWMSLISWPAPMPVSGELLALQPHSGHVGSTPKVGEHNEEVLGGLRATPRTRSRRCTQTR